jgi:hypothetical protein
MAVGSKRLLVPVRRLADDEFILSLRGELEFHDGNNGRWIKGRFCAVHD